MSREKSLLSRSERVTVRLYPQEKKTIEWKAAKLKKSVAEYCRLLILDELERERATSAQVQQIVHSLHNSHAYSNPTTKPSQKHSKSSRKIRDFSYDERRYAAKAELTMRAIRLFKAGRLPEGVGLAFDSKGFLFNLKDGVVERRAGELTAWEIPDILDAWRAFSSMKSTQEFIDQRRAKRI